MPTRPVKSVVAERDFLSAPPSTSVRDVARLMKTHHTSALLVLDAAGRLAGICTERDLVFDTLAEGLDPDATSVADIMTTEPLTIDGDKPFGHALHMMFEGGFRHVPVVDHHGRPLGIVSARDCLNLEACQFEQDLVRREEITVIL